MEEYVSERYTPVKLKYTSYSPSENFNCNDPPIILLHGFFGDNSSWNRVKGEISNRTRRKVYAVDLRNHGGSEYSEDFTLKHLTSDLLQLFKDLEIEKAILIGNSLGGRAGMELALSKPEMVEKLIIEDMSISDVDDEFRTKLINIAKAVQKVVSCLPVHMTMNDASSMMRRLLQKHIAQFSPNAEGSDLEKSLVFKKNKTTGAFEFCCNMDVLIRSLESIHILKNDLSTDPVYPGEVLFLSGELTVIPLDEDRDLILKHFPQAQFAVVKGGFHCTHAESPNEFIRVVTKFLPAEDDGADLAP